MKSTQIAELFANIKATFVSFFSILMFTALGVGIFLGINWSSTALQSAGDREYDEGSMHNFQLQFVYGLTDDDVAKISEREEVTDIETARQSFQVIPKDNAADITVKVQGITERMDVITVLEGELPTRQDEIALNKVAADKYDIAVGDTLTFEKDADSGGGLSLASIEDASASTEDKDGMKYLNASSFKVTALVKSPEYLAKGSETYGFSNAASGAVDLLAWVVPPAFDESAFAGGWPIVNIACDSLEGLGTFTGEYKSISSDIEQNVGALAIDLAQVRFNELYDGLKAKIDDAQKQLDEGKQKIADGEQKLSDARAQLETKRAEGEAKLEQGYQELLGYEEQRKSGEALLEEGRAKVQEGRDALATADQAKAAIASKLASIQEQADALRAEYEKSHKSAEDRAEYNKALDALGADLDKFAKPYADKLGVKIPKIDHENFFEVLDIVKGFDSLFEKLEVEYDGTTMTVADARVKLAEGEQQLAAAEAEYNQRVAQLEAGWAEYYAGQEELNNLVAQAESEIASGQQELDAAKATVAEKEPELEKAKNEFASVKNAVLAVMPRAYNAGAAEISTFSGVTTNLSFSMAALFIIVGLLVTYSAVSRIVHEQITQIGTKKALGLRANEITLSFLAYSAIAVVAGAIVGATVGFLAVEGIIGHALGGMFIFGDYPGYFGLASFVVVSLIELVLVLLATYLACRSILKEHAVELLKGEKPPTGKTRFYEKWALWDKLPLLTQTIVNNCVNDKRRVFSTIVGVAGCTALIVTALTLNNDVMKSYDAHYSNVYGFNAIAFVDSSVDNAIDNVKKAAEDAGAIAEPVVRKSFILKLPDGERGTLRIMVPQDGTSFTDLYHVNPLKGIPYDFNGEGGWLTQAYAEHFGAKVGDTVTLEDAEGKFREVPIVAFNEFWLTYHEMVLGRDYYESTFDESFVPNAILIDTRGLAVDELSAMLESVPGFDSVIDDKTLQYGNFATFSTVSSAVVLIYMVLALLMAVVVLLNLNVMFIDEKKRELIVLMINGFSVKDAKRYIYNDTIVLTAIGIILGVILGAVMGSITVASVEPSTASFVKSVDAMAVAVGAIGSAILSFVMSVIALRRIPNFDLTDINRF